VGVLILHEKGDRFVLSTFGTTPSALGGPAQVATNFRAPTDFAPQSKQKNNFYFPIGRTDLVTT